MVIMKTRTKLEVKRRPRRYTRRLAMRRLEVFEDASLVELCAYIV